MNLEDFMIFQIAEGSAESLSLVQGVFVYAEIEGTVQADAFAGLTYGELLIDPTDSGLTDSLVAAEGTGADAIVMLFINMITKRLRALPIGAYAWKIRDEGSTAAWAL